MKNNNFSSNNFSCIVVIHKLLRRYLGNRIEIGNILPLRIGIYYMPYICTINGTTYTYYQYCLQLYKGVLKIFRIFLS